MFGDHLFLTLAKTLFLLRVQWNRHRPEAVDRNSAGEVTARVPLSDHVAGRVVSLVVAGRVVPAAGLAAVVVVRVAFGGRVLEIAADGRARRTRRRW